MVEKDYYKILGVSPSATQEEIKKAFFRLAKKYHPDKHQGDQQNEYKVKFAEVNEAYNVLKDQTAKADYDAGVQDLSRGQKKSSHERYKSDELYHAALKAMKIKDFNSAIDLLKAAVRIEPDKAEYYSYLGLALAEKPRRLHEAREMCEKAVEIEPYDVQNYVNLGLVYKKARLHIRAQRQFQKALHWDPDNPVARAELGLSEDRGFLERTRDFFRRLTSKN